jgi:hypothetical protein
LKFGLVKLVEKKNLILSRYAQVKLVQDTEAIRDSPNLVNLAKNGHHRAHISIQEPCLSTQKLILPRTFAEIQMERNLSGVILH